MLRDFVVFTASMIIGAGGVMASPDPLTPSQLRDHPEIKGALKVIEAAFAGAHHYDQVPGMSAGIVYDQELVWTASYGYSNLETKQPAQADTIYSVCSISKLFTSIGLLQQRDAGALTLRDPVGKHLDWFTIEQTHPDRGPIDLRSLITHSSGLPRESDFPYWNAPDFPFPTNEALVERLAEQKTLYPPHELFQYSNLALSLAGEVVAAASGQAFDEYVSEHILRPLALGDTRPFYPENLRGKQLAVGYTGIHHDLKRHPVDPFFTRGVTAAAGFTSTVNDLARFASWQFRLLSNGGSEVLDSNTLREMHRVHWVDPDWKVTWGLGFAVRKVDDMTVVGHGGGCPGYITNFSMVPKHKVAVIVLTNAGDGPAGKLANFALKTLVPAVRSAATPAEDKPADLSMYEGNFDAVPWGGEVAIRQWGDHLVLLDMGIDEFGGELTRLKPLGDHRFVRLTKDDEHRESWVFELGEEGRATRVRRHSLYLNRVR